MDATDAWQATLWVEMTSCCTMHKAANILSLSNAIKLTMHILGPWLLHMNFLVSLLTFDKMRGGSCAEP